MPACGTSPMVGSIVWRAALLAGDTSEPSVAVPIDIGAYPTDTANAEPLEDPGGF